MYAGRSSLTIFLFFLRFALHIKQDIPPPLTAAILQGTYFLPLRQAAHSAEMEIPRCTAAEQRGEIKKKKKSYNTAVRLLRIQEGDLQYDTADAS